MLALERVNTSNNSKSFNPVTDDPRYLGYTALAYCIALPEKEYRRNYSKIMRVLHDGSVEREAKRKGDRIIVIDTISGTKKIFKTYNDASIYTGVSSPTINEAVCRERLVGKKWRFAIEKADEK